MYGIFTCIHHKHHKHQPNVGKYTIHGWYGDYRYKQFCNWGIWLYLAMSDPDSALVTMAQFYRGSFWYLHPPKNSHVQHTNCCLVDVSPFFPEEYFQVPVVSFSGMYLNSEWYRYQYVEKTGIFFLYNQLLSSWWFQPIWKHMLVKLDHFPRIGWK